MSASVEPNQTRLEFLGDSLLEMVVSHHLFCLLPDDEEGSLTHSRSGLIANKLNAVYASRIGLHTFVLLADRAANGNPWADEPVCTRQGSNLIGL